MIKFCGIVMIVCGIIMLCIPKNKLYNAEKIKTQEEIDKVVKSCKTSSIIFLVLGLFFLFVL